MAPESGTAALHTLRELERVHRRITGVGYGLIRQVAEAPPEEFGGQSARDVIADTLRITGPDAGARLAEAADLTPGLTLTGEPLEALLPTVARRVETGAIGREHVRVIRQFLCDLPSAVDLPTRMHAEQELADTAMTLRPDQLRKLARHLDAMINPDGRLEDESDRQRRRGITLGEQQRDTLSRISGWISAEFRGYLEAILAKLARPGACVPDDASGTAGGGPTPEAEPDGDEGGRDTRTVAQRNHDALLTALRDLLASDDLGQHRGLPVTVVVTTTLQDLERAARHAAAAETGPASGTTPAGNPTHAADHSATPPPEPPPPAGRKARTAGGTLIPMPDLIRMAAHSWHYLAVFDSHTDRPLYLGRTKRLASPDQRLVAAAQYGGCTFPGCARPAAECEYHHCNEWADWGPTDITNLAPACRKHHVLVDHGWTVRRTPTGRIEWIPPAWLDPDRKPRTNTYHRPGDRYRADSPAA
ncbi:HNH endonuclease signature motif containing protein [Skermania piniformis]|uniref:HNH endonuclease n=1 Tax=Skermania pinensis TaxID=39122 RepID=A0ABX8SCG1_9ACTN|nr:HNH endonuclease signature motif containing protein [Skermania piniformis]QXQ14285.1 HNH endonuclease [Skermania piniformis]